MDGPATVTTFGGDYESQTAEKLKTKEKGLKLPDQTFKNVHTKLL